MVVWQQCIGESCTGAEVVGKMGVQKQCVSYQKSEVVAKHVREGRWNVKLNRLEIRIKCPMQRQHGESEEKGPGRNDKDRPG